MSMSSNSSTVNMAFCLRTTSFMCKNAKVLTDPSRWSNTFLNALRAPGQQQWLAVGPQRFLSLQPPKRPAGAFFKFMNLRAREILSKSPDASQLQKCKVAGQLWRDLDSQEKDRLKEEAKEEFQVYHQQYQIYLAQLSKQEKARLQHERKEKRMTRANRRHKKELHRMGRPKKPPNSFNLFVKASRLQQSHAEPPTFLKALVVSWKLMTEGQKEVYKANASLEKEKYEKEMAKWEQKMTEMGRGDLIRKKSQLASSPSFAKILAATKKSTKQSQANKKKT